MLVLLQCFYLFSDFRQLTDFFLCAFKCSLRLPSCTSYPVCWYSPAKLTFLFTPYCLTQSLCFFLSVSLVNCERTGGTFHQRLPEKQKQPLSMERPNILHPPASLLFFCFPSFLTESLTLCSALVPPTPIPPNQPSTPHALSSATPSHPSPSLLHKLPVIDPGHIAVVFPPVCLLEPQHPGPALNEAPTKAHWWEAQCKRGWPQPRAPRTGHQLPKALPPHKDVHCGQRPERAQR